MRIISSLVAQFSFQLEQLDVKIAFLYGELDNTIHMEQLERCQVQSGVNIVYLLKKNPCIVFNISQDNGTKFLTAMLLLKVLTKIFMIYLLIL